MLSIIHRCCDFQILRQLWSLIFFLLLSSSSALAEVLEPIVISKTEPSRFVFKKSQRPFIPWGFNYDHDDSGKLLEDYWETDWEQVEGDFREMRELGVNTVRIHLQFGKFMEAEDRANQKALNQLAKLIKLAEQERLYLDLTGLGCYHKKDVPAWYDKLEEQGRWKAQAAFWKEIAKTVAKSPAVFCYDLMNEPVVPGGKRADGEWLGPPFGDKHFVQFITLEQGDRTRPEIAREWAKLLVKAIREVDEEHLITIGLVDWSLNRPGLTSGFVPMETCQELDFLCVHIYPKKGELKQALETLEGFQIGKPVVIEETFPLNTTFEEMDEFLKALHEKKVGCISFYWGKPIKELEKSGTLRDAILAKWLERFSAEKPDE